MAAAERRCGGSVLVAGRRIDRRGRIGIAQQALILESKDPPELLFPGDRRDW